MDYDGPIGDIEAYVVGEGHLKQFEYDFIGVAQGSLFVSESNGYRDITGLLPNTATHELTHVVAGRAFPSIPRWLNEGLATYLETAKLTDPKHLKIGAGIWGYQADLLGGLVATLDELWAWGTGEEPKDELSSRLYATSWAFVHYLSNHERARFTSWLKTLREGEEAHASFERIFPRFAEVEGVKAIEHMNGGAFVSATLPLTGGPKVSVAEMSPAAVHLARRQIWSLAIRMTDERREAERAKDLQLARTLPSDDSTETLRELLDLGVISHDQFLTRAKGRRDVLREGALFVERGTPASDRVLQAALDAAPRDPVLGALRALQLTGSDAQQAERALASLEPLADEEARMRAALASLAMLQCEKATAYLEGVRHRGARGLRNTIKAHCAVRPLQCNSSDAVVQALGPALQTFQGLLGAPVGHRVKVRMNDPASVVVEPPNAVLAGFARRVVQSSACAGADAIEVDLDLTR